MGAAAVKKQDTGPAKRRVPGVFFPLHGKKMGILPPPPVQEKNELRKEKNYAIQNDSPDAGGGAEEAGLP